MSANGRLTPVLERPCWSFERFRNLHGGNMLPDGYCPGCERDHTVMAMQLLRPGPADQGQGSDGGPSER